MTDRTGEPLLEAGGDDRGRGGDERAVRDRGDQLPDQHVATSREPAQGEHHRHTGETDRHEQLVAIGPVGQRARGQTKEEIGQHARGQDKSDGEAAAARVKRQPCRFWRARAMHFLKEQTRFSRVRAGRLRQLISFHPKQERSLFFSLP